MAEITSLETKETLSWLRSHDQDTKIIWILSDNHHFLYFSLAFYDINLETNVPILHIGLSIEVFSWAHSLSGNTLNSGLKN